MQSFHIFLACAFGAGIGSLVALELSAAFWWVGMIVGGLVGYCSYDWRGIMRAIPQAYRHARGVVIPPEFFKGIGWMFFSILVAYVNCLVVLTFLFYANGRGWWFSHYDMDRIWSDFVALSTIAIPVYVIYVAPLLRDDCGVGLNEGHRKSVYWFAPPLLYFYHIPRGLWWVMKRTPRATMVFLRFARRFGWELFLLIHSKERVTCAAAAFIGTGIGYFAGSALIGAVAGGLFGVVDHRFVTKRWLEPRGLLQKESAR